MTLKQAIELMEKVASSQPSINLIVRDDIFKLNSFEDAKYGVFGWTQGNHTTSVDNVFAKYSFSLYYIDRLNEDRSNLVEVQSTGIETISNILRKLDETIFVNDATYTTFSQRFLDECGGVFCNVSFDVRIDNECEESFTDRVVEVR